MKTTLSKDERRIEALKAAITESRTWRMVSGENPERASVGPMKQSQEPDEAKSEYLKMLKRRAAWGIDALNFWTSEYADNGDIKSHEAMSIIRALLMRTHNQLFEAESAMVNPSICRQTCE